MTLNIYQIRQRVTDLGEKINAPSHLLLISDQPMSNAAPYIEVEDQQYHYVVPERGQELSRSTTGDVDQLLYWVFRSITSDMALDYELANRDSNQDSRRLRFSHQLLLMKTINAQWEASLADEIEGILKSSPYDDFSGLRADLVLS